MNLDLHGVFAAEGTVLPFEQSLDLSDLDFKGTYPLKQPAVISGTVENHAGVVQLDAVIQYLYCALCDRCAVPVERMIRLPVSHVLVRQLNQEDNDAFVVVEDENLDVDALMREDIVLSLPAKFLCKEDCRGLCPVCGKNRNEGECGCSTRSMDPRLEALKQLLD